MPYKTTNGAKNISRVHVLDMIYFVNRLTSNKRLIMNNVIWSTEAQNHLFGLFSIHEHIEWMALFEKNFYSIKIEYESVLIFKSSTITILSAYFRIFPFSCLN